MLGASVRPVPDAPGPGQESVWDYPRPAIAQACGRHLRVVHHGVVIAETRRGVRTLETSHPPSYYFPPEDVDQSVLRVNARRSWCEWKGAARYFDVVTGDELLVAVAWSYPQPTETFARLAGHIAFYPGAFDLCSVDGNRVRAQEGGFYGGWISDDLAGPFKGGPGTLGW